jgi:hypothetical protein
MLEILGILVAIGVFVFWCDVTDSWNNVFRWAKTRMDPRRAALAHHQTRAAQEQTAEQEVSLAPGRSQSVGNKALKQFLQAS